jgi:hypothetical protein
MRGDLKGDLGCLGSFILFAAGGIIVFYMLAWSGIQKIWVIVLCMLGYIVLYGLIAIWFNMPEDGDKKE